MNTKFTEQTMRGLKATAVALKLPIEEVDYEALMTAIQNLTTNQQAILVNCFGFVDDGPCSIFETCKKLNTYTRKSALNHLRNALVELNMQKFTFYPHKNSDVSNSDEISEMWDLNLRAYHCLQKADKHSLEDVENMTLQELMDLPGIKTEDFSNILMAIEKYRRAKRIFENTLSLLSDSKNNPL